VTVNPGRLTLLTREGCGLCEEFADELAQLGGTLALPPLETLDVDSDPEMLRRYGHKIPFLLWDGAPIAVTRLDPGEIERLFRVR
jgi:hypothetical protein